MIELSYGVDGAMVAEEELALQLLPPPTLKLGRKSAKKLNKQFTLIINQKNNFMKINKLFLLAMGLVAVGCSDSQIEEQSLINDAQGEAVEVVLEGVVNNAVGSQARSVAEVTDAGAVRIEFDASDEIGVYLNNEKVGLTHENVKFTVKSTEKDENGAVHATFTTSEPMILLGAGNNVYAYYPYEATETEFEGTSRSTDRGAWDGYHWFNIPAEQVQAGLGDYSNLAEYVHLYAPERQLAKQGNKVVVAAPGLQFRHAFAYVTLNLKNSYDRSLAIAKATIKAFNDGEPVALAGDFAVALDDAQMATEGLASVVAGENVQNVVTVSAPTDEGLELAAEAKSWIPVAIAAGVTFDALEVTVETVDGFVYKQDLKVGSFTMPQNYSQPINFTLSDESLSSIVTNSDVAEYLLHLNKEHIVLDVAANIELKINRSSDDAWGGANTKTITINGGADGLAANRTISFNMSEQLWSDVDLVNTDATLYINNLKLQTTGWDPTSKAGYSKTDLMFNCKVNLENVFSLSAIMAHRSFTANTLIVYDLKAGASTNNYALWLAPAVEEQIVNINGFQTLNMTAKGERGIKIDADTSYASFDKAGLGPQKVVLTLKGNNYFNTTKKAAILVRTKVGAEINIEGNMDIANVVDDQVNHVWIDEATCTKEYFDQITVINGNYKIEGASWSVKANNTAAIYDNTAVADGQDAMIEALQTFGFSTIELVDGAYTLPDIGSATESRDVTFSGGAGAVITIADNHTNAYGTLTFDGVSVKSSDADVNGIKQATKVTYNKAVIYPMSIFGTEAVFNQCTFDLTTANSTGDYLYLRTVDKAAFDGCKFATNGKAILISNTTEGAETGACEVSVKNTHFTATKSATASAIQNMAVAAIDISNAGKDGASLAHKLTTSGNTVTTNFSGEWRIKTYVEGNPVTVNGKEYTCIAVDGKKIVQDENGGYYYETIE